jgi:hypothetical protein
MSHEVSDSLELIEQDMRECATGKSPIYFADRIRALRQGGGWQPIETAPKDKSVLLFFPLIYAGCVEVGRYDDDRYAAKGARPFWRGSQPNNLTAYRSAPPTQWQPHPPAPAVKDEQT